MATKKADLNQNAVLYFAGKQYLVKVGDKIEAEKIEAKQGEKITVKNVLLVSAGDATSVGMPYLVGASVDLKLDSQSKMPKVEIRKFKAKSRYRRTTGHRQPKSTLTVTGINLK